MAYRRVEGVLAQTVDGRVMLIPPSGAEVLVLNGTGSAVWDAIVAAEPGAAELDALTASVCAAHPAVAPEVVAADVASFVAEIRDAGLVAEA